MKTESAVKERYANAARSREAALCCPVDYDPQHLQAIPEEVIEKDYGCGDPARFLVPGDTVLDLGSGTGKICFIAAQIVGPEGRVIGVDMNDDMLEVARRNAPAVAKAIGYDNVEFRKGRIQDLALDLEALDDDLRQRSLGGANSFLAAEERADELRHQSPLVPDGSVDAVVSNCVLNLVDNRQKDALFAEIFRVLKKGGRAIISDIVSDEPVPERLRNDPELWSGCISGAYTERGFLEAFEKAGFHAIEQVNFDTVPWQTVDGIEFRSVTVRAYKGKQGPCLEQRQAVIYKGPFKSITDDDGHRYSRGVRHAVCDKTFHLLQQPPYQPYFDFLEPRQAISEHQAQPFDHHRSVERHPRETKGDDYQATSEPNGSSCC